MTSPFLYHHFRLYLVQLSMMRMVGMMGLAQTLITTLTLVGANPSLNLNLILMVLVYRKFCSDDSIALSRTIWRSSSWMSVVLQSQSASTQTNDYVEAQFLFLV